MSLGHTALVLVIYVLASMRVTRLLNGDKITDPIRARLLSRSIDFTKPEKVRQRWTTALYYVQCPWCIGFWVCLAAAYPVTRIVDWDLWVMLPLAFAANHLVGVFAFAADTEEIEVEHDE